MVLGVGIVLFALALELLQGRASAGGLSPTASGAPG